MKNLETLSNQALKKINGGQYGGEDSTCPEIEALIQALRYWF